MSLQVRRKQPIILLLFLSVCQGLSVQMKLYKKVCTLLKLSLLYGMIVRQAIPLFFLMFSSFYEYSDMKLPLSPFFIQSPYNKRRTSLLRTVLLCRGDRTRTCDSLVPNQERYQLRYTSFFLRVQR